MRNAVHPHIRGAYQLLSGQRGIPIRFIPTYVGHTCRPPEMQFLRTVHPHIRGAYHPAHFLPQPDFGSSPHTWGIRNLYILQSEWFPVHPHIRGAYDPGAGGPGKHLGSSPHTWGIPFSAPSFSIASGFIPTYVGHTPAVGSSAHRQTVHPHIRGAYNLYASAAAISTGSSPHTWGIRDPGGHQLPAKGFIPTYVGHTSFGRPPNERGPVHPHIRGAYRNTEQKGSEIRGSSPHTWGIRWVETGPFLYSRFIPTYVGHTLKRKSALRSATVHPHIRGAYICNFASLLRDSGSSPHTWGIRLVWGMNRALYGSSPHTWGIPALAHQSDRGQRFIPTYVGHTLIVGKENIDCTVHPHIRGAYYGMDNPLIYKGGSSPHTWGIRGFNYEENQ